MNGSFPRMPLARLVRDLTPERLVVVGPNDDVVNPTIASRTHSISVASVQKGISVGVRKRVRLLAGDLVFSRLHTQNGLFAFADRSYLATTTFIPLAVDETQVDRRFLFWALHVRVPTLSTSDTVGRETYRPQDILGLEIPLPSVPEQRLIAARVDQLAAKIEEAQWLRERAAEEAEALVDSGLARIFEGQVDKKGWEPKPLTQAAAEIARGRFAHRPRNDPRFYGGSIPFIQIGDISSSDRYVRDHSQTLNQEGLGISRMFPKGTVVMAITGATIGVTGILTFDSCFPDSIVGIVPQQDTTIPEFVYWAIEYAKRGALAGATQTTQPNINLKDLERLRVPIPPLPEQRHIVAYLDDLQAKVHRLKRLQAETAAELDAMLPSILDKAFEGEL